MWQDFPSVGLGQKNWGLILLQHDYDRNYGPSLRKGARLWSARIAEKRRQVDLLWGGRERNVCSDRCGRGSAQHWEGGLMMPDRGRIEMRHWRILYRIGQWKEAAYHWKSDFLCAYRPEGFGAKGTQGVKLGWLIRVGSYSPTCELLGSLPP